MNLTRSIVLGSVALLAALTATVAVAGAALSSPVSVGSSYAGGSYDDARDSSDSTQYIFCQSSVSGGADLAYCAARDASGAYRSCTAVSDAQRALIRDLSPSGGYLYFTVASGNCSYMSASQDSRYLP